MIRALALVLALAACASPARAQAPLDSLAAFEGCWIGEFAGQSGLQDRRCFTSMQGGKQWRDVHEVVGVGYGGETIYAWDAEAARIAIVYFANDGGLMQGVGAFDDDELITEARYVGANGAVQRLRSHWKIEGADRFEIVTEREEAGVWAPFMRISYAREAPR